MNATSQGEDTSPVPDYGRLWRLDQQVFIVLGAGQGIGRQAAHALSQAGATVVCVGRRAEATQAIAAEVGGVAIVGDATVRADVERIAAEVMQRFGRIHGLVDILGMPRVKPLVAFTDEDWDWQFNVGLRHAFLSLQIVGPLIGQSGGGAMVFVSSTSGKVISSERAAYASSKAALQQLVTAAAIEFGPMQVRVNAVAPGLVMTPRVSGSIPPETLRQSAALYPLGQVGTPPQIASVILFLSSALSSHVNGQTVFAEGGVSARSPLYATSSARPPGVP
ncbi:MAG: SDR family NAD(P)-dependent oxidoreductase [Hydrogenophaga sp.]|uniref:SDR family NAD(P)-dependent oxidoreductase n=1 Tax=Hydrogenophaga sp. TaxID=1904254 RepID=UPI003D0D7F29